MFLIVLKENVPHIQDVNVTVLDRVIQFCSYLYESSELTPKSISS